MALECYYDHDAEAGDTVWLTPHGWSRHKRRRTPKCCSCSAPVPAETDCLTFHRYKLPDYEIEIRIYGEDGEVPRAPWFMCWECGWRFNALHKHGYALHISDDMRQLMIEHDDLTATGSEGCQ